MKQYWHDRIEAGNKLALALLKYENQDVVVYALPRGGVVLAAEVAKELEAPLDLLLPRKIGHPASPEYAIAAITEDGEIVFDDEHPENFDATWLEQEINQQKMEAIRRRELYLEGREPFDVKNKVAIIVDDGLATGLTMLAAIRQMRKQKPLKIVVAVPVAPDDTALKVEAEANELVILHREKWGFGAVGSYYQIFEQVGDSEVQDILSLLE